MRSDESSTMRASGKRSATSSAMRSTPGPQATRLSSASHFGQRFGSGSEKPQWWQFRRPAKAVLDQPGRALRTFDAVAACAAERQRRITAPVEKQQRLLLFGERLVHRLDQRRGQPLAALGRVLRRSIGVISGSSIAGEAARQNEMAIAPVARIDMAFDRRRRRRQHDRRTWPDAGAHDGHVAALIVDAILLLEPLIVLFVDDDEA